MLELLSSFSVFSSLMCFLSCLISFVFSSLLLLATLVGRLVFSLFSCMFWLVFLLGLPFILDVKFELLAFSLHLFHFITQ